MSAPRDPDFRALCAILLLRWRFLLLVAACAALAAFAVTFAVKPMFRSTVTMLPATQTDVSRLVSSDAVGSRDFNAFGSDAELEQLQQILLSDAIREAVVAEFDLMSHYDIDRNGRYPNTQLANQFAGSVKVRKTRFSSVEVEVTDTDPRVAANIANRIIDLVDTVYHAIQLERAREALTIVEREYGNVRAYVKGLEDSLDAVRRMGVNNYKAESEVYNAAYAEALASGNREGARAIEEKIAVLSRYGGASAALQAELELEQKRLSLLRDKLLSAQVNVNQTLPRKFVVNRATVAEKKYYPRRLLAAFLAAGAALLVAALWVVAVDSNKK